MCIQLCIGKANTGKMAPNNNSNNNNSENNGEKPKPKKSRRRVVPKDSPEYQLRRDRNNIAVRKSRTNTKIKTKQTVERVSELRNENAQLEQQVQLLAKELGVLKDLFKMSHPETDAGLEAGIQTDDDDISGAQGMVDAIKIEEFDLLNGSQGVATDNINTEEFDFLNNDHSLVEDVKANAHAVQRDHQYFVKAE